MVEKCANSILRQSHTDSTPPPERFPINEQEPWGTPEYVEEVKTRCPNLVAHLKALMRNDNKIFTREEDKEIQRIFIILSILCYTRNVQISNCFQKSFGMHMHSLGTKRRLLEMFNSFGLTCSYGTIVSMVKELAEEGKACNGCLNMPLILSLAQLSNALPIISPPEATPIDR
jgi:hypothetical protein